MCLRFFSYLTKIVLNSIALIKANIHCYFLSLFITNHHTQIKPTNLQEILIVKSESERLGMHIKGGLNGQRGNPIDPADEGVFVSKINSNGAARRDGRLKV